jgi:hypothetical protein
MWSRQQRRPKYAYAMERVKIRGRRGTVDRLCGMFVTPEERGEERPLTALRQVTAT